MEITFYKFLVFVLFMGDHLRWIDSSTDVKTLKTVDVSCKRMGTYLRSTCYIYNTTEITEGVHFHITNIDEWKNATTLNLLSRRLNILPLGLCEQLTKLQDFDCTYAQYNSIQKESFIGGNELVRISFRRNKLEKIPANLFAYATKVEYINFKNNSISEIEPYAFNGTDSLLELYLANNLLTKIEQNTFTGAPNLEYLYLSGNSIEIIEDGALNFPKLIHLDLSRNYLKVLSDKLFFGTSVVQRIILAKNNISLVNHSLDNLPKLSLLNLSENKVTDLDIRTQARKVTVLAVRDIGLKLEDLVSSENETYSVRYLDISKNNLGRPDILRYLKNFVHVRVLNLGHNNLSEIERVEQIPSILPELVFLEIKGNKVGDCEVEALDERSVLCSRSGLVRMKQF